MGVFQLPDSVDGDAAGCLVYSFVCLSVNALLIWLIWAHHERTSYVAYISYFTFLATISSIVQQIYDYTMWRDIMTEQFYYGKAHADDAETQYQKGIMGLKLALSYIRIFCFIVESSLVFFFSLSLAATVYGWWATKPQTLRKLSITGRIFPVALAVLSIILLQLPFTHKSFTLYLIIANAQLVLSLAGSCVFLLMILCKYVQTRRQLKTWQSIQYGKFASTGTSGMKSAYSRRSRAYSTAGKPSATFDSWLVIRLSIAFMALCVFEWTNIAPRISAKGHIVESANETEPDLSEKRAMSTVTGYLSGVSPSLLAFIVFGTTKTFQRKMFNTFVPKVIRRRICGTGKRDDEDGDFACRNANGRLPFASSSSGAGSSFARASTLVVAAPPPRSLGADAKSIGSVSVLTPPRTPRTPRTPRQGSKLERASFLMPIQEPDPISINNNNNHNNYNATDDVESQMLRRSQIGVALTGTPEPQSPRPTLQPSGRRATFSTIRTFFRNDSDESLQQIPLSRFNMKKHNHDNNDDDDDDDDDNRNNNHHYNNTSNGGKRTNRPIPGRTDSFASTTTTTTIWSEGRSGSAENRAHGRTRFGSVS